VVALRETESFLLFGLFFPGERNRCLGRSGTQYKHSVRIKMRRPAGTFSGEIGRLDQNGFAILLADQGLLVPDDLAIGPCVAIDLADDKRQGRGLEIFPEGTDEAGEQLVIILRHLETDAGDVDVDTVGEKRGIWSAPHLPPTTQRQTSSFPPQEY